jgi:photosystem II stability/assembly factor-like uncharacterized protein
MKKTLFFLIIFHFSLIIANAQWLQQNSGTTQNLYDIKFINKYTGWALGDAGLVLKTTNGGTNWINVPNPSMSKPLTEIHPVNSNIVYFVGAHSTYIKTTNGGANWIEIRNGPYGSGMGFESVFFLNKDTGWACGNMRVLRTTNGGQTFDDSAGIFWGSLHDMYFKDFNNGIICGDGKVFKTTDGGSNWFDTNVPTNGWAPMFMKIGIAEKKYVWVAGYNRAGVYKSTDFAISWNETDTVHGADGIFFLNKDTGFIGGGLNSLFKTTNGGYNWWQENTGTGGTALITSVYFANDSLGWYVSLTGKIYHTTTGGQVLQIINSNEQIADDFKLYQNFPNPFNAETTIEFDIKKTDLYKMEVFDLLGRKVDILFSKQLKQGKYQFTYNGEKLSSGLYFYKIQFVDPTGRTGNFVQVKKMLMIK